MNYLDFNKKLNLQYSIYDDRINSVDNKKMKKRAESKYIIFQNENKIKKKEIKKKRKKEKNIYRKFRKIMKNINYQLKIILK